jgi:hypothetical protein
MPMNIDKFISRCFLLTIFTAVPVVSAQTEISRRTELQTGTVVPIQAGTISSRDIGPAQIGTLGASGTAVTSEVEVITFGYQIPDFDPDDLYTHLYHFGMFSETGNGSGTVYPDTDGYVEYEMTRHSRESEMQTFLYSVHAETGEVRAFIDIDDLTVNMAVGILANLALNARSNTERYAQRANAGFARPASRMPLEIGNQHRLGLHGDYLTLEDIQEQIFSQTRCNVEEDIGRYYLESCR